MLIFKFCSLNVRDRNKNIQFSSEGMQLESCDTEYLNALLSATTSMSNSAGNCEEVINDSPSSPTGFLYTCSSWQNTTYITRTRQLSSEVRGNAISAFSQHAHVAFTFSENHQESLFLFSSLRTEVQVFVRIENTTFLLHPHELGSMSQHFVMSALKNLHYIAAGPLGK